MTQSPNPISVLTKVILVLKRTMRRYGPWMASTSKRLVGHDYCIGRRLIFGLNVYTLMTTRTMLSYDFMIAIISLVTREGANLVSVPDSTRY